MAITAAQLQAELGTNGMNARVLRAFGTYGTEQHWLVMGQVDVPGRVRTVATTASDNAATQAAAVLTALRA
jgi:hypothetical protein